MRIIAGQRKGLTLSRFEAEFIRPTKDIVKEFIFNCLANITDISACRVCDLFAGTGSLGIEALSRGAYAAVFVENDLRAIEIIRRNLKKAKFDSTDVIQTDALNFLENTTQKQFDLMFADPPYPAALGNFIIDNVSANDYLAAHGILVLETSPDESFKPVNSWPSLKLVKQKKWGESCVTIFQKTV